MPFLCLSGDRNVHENLAQPAPEQEIAAEENKYAVKKVSTRLSSRQEDHVDEYEETTTQANEEFLRRASMENGVLFIPAYVDEKKSKEENLGKEGEIYGCEVKESGLPHAGKG